MDAQGPTDSWGRTPSPRRHRWSWALWGIATVVTLGVLAFGGHESKRSAASTLTSTIDVEPAVFTTPPPETFKVVVTDAPPSTTVAGTDAGGLNPLGGNQPEDKLMPDVVCMNLQAAQDLIQDHGVFYSKSKDASGKGRRQIWDRNWTVVRQDPAAGQPIGEGDALLYVVKKGEPSDC